MARKSKSSSSTGLSDEQRELLTNLHAALGAVLGGASGEAAAEGGDELGGLEDGEDSELDLEGDDAEEAEGPTEDDVRAALKKVLKAKDKSTVAKILKKFSVETVSDLDEKKYADVIKLAEKVAGK